MSLSPAKIVLEYVCPTLGGIVGTYMFYAPFQDVQKALARGFLGDLNPLPWAFTLGNCCGWVTYGILISNVFVYAPNILGFFLAVWFNLAASKLLYQQQFAPIITTTTLLDAAKEPSSSTSPAPTATIHSAPTYDYWIMAIVVIWSAIISLVGFADSISLDNKQWIVGGAANLNLVFFYGSPLSTIATVLKTKNTASIHFLTMVANTANGVFWACYGFAIVDYLIFVPNGLGALLGFIQFGLYLTFPRIMMTDENGVVVAGDNEQAQPLEEMGGDDTITLPSKKDEEEAAIMDSALTAITAEESDNLVLVPLKADVENKADTSVTLDYQC